MRTLFAYGTLIFDEVMRQVTGRTFRGIDALLPGYARYRIKDAPYPGIIPCDGAVVKGKVYFDIDDKSLAMLDQYEGGLYEKITVQVRIDNGETCDAIAYKVKDTHKGMLTHELWAPGELEG